MIEKKHLIRGDRGKKYIRLVLASLKTYSHELLENQRYIDLAGLGLVWGWFGADFGMILRLLSVASQDL